MLLLSLCLTFSLSSYSQVTNKLGGVNLVLEGRVYYGWTMAHHLEMEIFQRHYPSFEISLFKATYGKTRWEWMYGYPNIGLSYWYSGLGNTKWLGQAHAVFPYINFTLFNKEVFTLSFRFGVGLGYLTKKFDRVENYKNLAIGSHFNAAVNLLLDFRWRLGPRFLASTGIGIMHFSNGTIKTPNFGLNIPSVHMAIAYRLSRETSQQRKKLIPMLVPYEFDGKKSILLDLNLAVAVKDMQAQLGVGNSYMVYTLFGNLMKPISYKFNLGMGFDISYDASDYKLLELREEAPEKKIQIVKTGLNVAFELSFARAAMMFNAGFYLTGLDQTDGQFYEKLALRFDITKRLFASLTFKAHYARADFLALGIGYKFNFKYY